MMILAVCVAAVLPRYVAFELDVNRGGAGNHPGNCQLQDAASPVRYTGNFHNLALFVKD